MVYEWRVTPHGDKVEVCESTEDLSLCACHLCSLAELFVNMTENYVSLVDKGVISLEHSLYIVLLCIESKFVEHLKVCVITSLCTTCIEVISEHSLAKKYVVLPSSDLKIHCCRCSKNLFVSTVICLIVEHTLLWDVKKRLVA